MRTLTLLLLLSLFAGCDSPRPGMSCAEAEMLVPTVRWQELQARCWYIAINKTQNQWTMHAKTQKPGDLVSKTYYVEAGSFDEAVAMVLRQMQERKGP